MLTTRHKLLATSIAALLAQTGMTLLYAQDNPANGANAIDEMVVTTVRMSEPLLVETDPRKPRQPLPAHDGADFLKTIPGFSVIRKGGADGDPVFRGMAGSRLSLQVDGESVLGGCGHRMDPPTAYIFPEAFESIQVIKGPQSVQHGPGNAAGVVKFERNRTRVTEPAVAIHTSVLGASFGRHDEVLDASYKTPEFTLRAIGTNASQNNYKDGDGTKVHSKYQRWSSQLSAAWTPSDTQFYEITAGRSDGEAAYADRAMDGSLFEREHYGFKGRIDNVTTLISNIEFQYYYQYIDHVMDNYSLRTRAAGVPERAMNPDRETRGGKFAATLQPFAGLTWVIGMDAQGNEHSDRSSMNMAMTNYKNLTRKRDAEFSQHGAFTEVSWDYNPTETLSAGVRADRWRVEDHRSSIMLSHMMTLPNPTAGMERTDTLTSAFIRLESQLSELPGTVYVGVGHNERFPDYWELISKESTATASAFNSTAPEKLTQLDAGYIYNAGNLRGSFSVFYNEIKDYILIDSAFTKPAAMMGVTRVATIARNVDARSWGAEADFTYGFTDNWRTELTLASVRGENKTDSRTLAQLPPLEARVGVHYDNQIWSFGTLLRAIGSQDRVDIGRGNIAGQDFSTTHSANVMSLNAGWKPAERWLLSAGIDNLFDESYAEHISRAGTDVAGYNQIARVNEPGRTLWMKAQFTF